MFYPELRKRLELSEQLFACNKQLPAAKEVDEQLLNAKIEKQLSASKEQPSASKKQLPTSKGQQSDSDEQLTAASELQSASRKQLPATLAQQASAIQCDVVLHCQDGKLELIKIPAESMWEIIIEHDIAVCTYGTPAPAPILLETPAPCFHSTDEFCFLFPCSLSPEEFCCLLPAFILKRNPFSLPLLLRGNLLPFPD